MYSVEHPDSFPSICSRGAMRVENETLCFRVPEFEVELKLHSYDRVYICHVQKAWARPRE